MSLIDRAIATLLHYANSRPPYCGAESFYQLKAKLLQKHGIRLDDQYQKIIKECWGDRFDEWGDRYGCGPDCTACGGTGIYLIKYFKLEHWEWQGYLFHSNPVRVWPHHFDYELPISLEGKVKHKEYRHHLCRESRLWLYLLCGEWAKLWHAMTTSCCARVFPWPLLTIQWAIFNVRHEFRSWSGQFKHPKRLLPQPNQQDDTIPF